MVVSFYTINCNIYTLELVFKVLIGEVFKKVEIGYKYFSQDTGHVSEISYLICYPFFKTKKTKKKKSRVV